MTDHTFRATIANSVRLPNTVSGAPRYSVHIAGGGALRTEADGQVAYVIHEGMIGRLAEFTVDSRDRITHIALV